MIGTLTKAAGLLTAATVLGGGLWTAGDYLQVRPAIKRELVQLQQQVDTVSQSVLLNRFQYLQAKEKQTRLSFDEKQEMCRIAKALQYVGVPGC